jgi:hypothetical protein
VRSRKKEKQNGRQSVKQPQTTFKRAQARQTTSNGRSPSNHFKQAQARQTTSNHQGKNIFSPLPPIVGKNMLIFALLILEKSCRCEPNFLSLAIISPKI